jgi:nucleoside-diphosphate-sugar epimerase
MSDGSPRRPLVHIEDIARVAAAAIDAPRDAVHNQVFNVGGNSENYRVRDLAEIVAATVPNSVVEYVGNGGSDHRDYWVDFSKLSQHLPGFTLKWDARAGAQELYGAFREQGVAAHDLEHGSRYIRLRRLRRLMETAELDGDLRWRVD